jgi:hypothetical protein
MTGSKKMSLIMALLTKYIVKLNFTKKNYFFMFFEKDGGEVFETVL